MKTNFARVTYNGEISETGDWYRYGEVCDVCKKHYRPDGTFHSIKPDLTEMDLCSDCIRLLLNNKIKYNDAISTFTVELDGKKVVAYSNIDGSFLKEGMLYIGKRNTGWQLGKCLLVQDGYVMSDPPGKLYSYNTYECRVVKSIENAP